MTTILKFGARLRASRKAAGFRTSKEFLEKHSVPASTYSQHESGSRSPNEETLLFYSKIFGVNFDWLKSGKGLPYQKSTLNQKEILAEELTELRNPRLKSIDPSLLTLILQELLMIDPSPNKIKSTSIKAATIYNKMVALDIPQKSQKKALKKLLEK